MRAGRMDRRIVIESYSATQDGAGEEVKTWSNFATRWAEKRDVKASERFASVQVLAERSVVFRIYWLEGLNEKMRVNYGGLLYDINGLAEIGRREGIEILATATVDTLP